MAEILAILSVIILGAAGSALWDLCKTAYKKQNNQNPSLLNLFNRNRIQTLELLPLHPRTPKLSKTFCTFCRYISLCPRDIKKIYTY